MAKRRANGDICDRCRWQMEQAKRSGSKDEELAQAGTLTHKKVNRVDSKKGCSSGAFSEKFPVWVKSGSKVSARSPKQ